VSTTVKFLGSKILFFVYLANYCMKVVIVDSSRLIFVFVTSRDLPTSCSHSIANFSVTQQSTRACRMLHRSC
jgi:hypothetical protein